jgi:hypothetical protein
MTGPRSILATDAARTLLVGAFLLAILVPAPARAQPRVERLERLEISLWPEYDQPSMLVMLKGWLPASTTLPATVRLPMPAEAGVPNAVAYRGPDGSMLMAAHRFEDQGEWVYVDLTTQSTEIRLEYYVALDTTKPDRSYRFEWPSGIEVAQVTYDVLQPRGSRGLQVVPPGAKSALNDGLIEERANLGPVPRGAEFTIEVRYSKPSADLTLAPVPPAAAPSTSPSTLPVPTEPEDSKPQSWLLFLVVATVAFLVGFWLGRSRKPTRE